MRRKVLILPTSPVSLKKKKKKKTCPEVTLSFITVWLLTRPHLTFRGTFVLTNVYETNVNAKIEQIQNDSIYLLIVIEIILKIKIYFNNN